MLNIIIVVLLVLGLFIYLRRRYGSFDIRNFSISDIVRDFKKKSIKSSVNSHKKQLVEKRKSKFVNYYYNLIQSTLDNLEYSSTVEWFTFITLGISFVVFIIVFMMVQNVLISVLSVLSVASAGISALATMGKRKASLKLNAILDATDLLCAYISKGTSVAIQDNLGNIDIIIRYHFEDFLSERKDGVPFDVAMDHLNGKLGRSFDNFARKAKVYEKERLKGMDQNFKDIIDDNAVTREVSIEKEKTFHDMNLSYLLKLIIIVIFAVFSFFTNDGMHHFLANTVSGKIFITICLVICSIIFAYTQLTQLDLTFGGDD